MSYRNKVYVAFSADDGDITGDMKYYNLMKAWKENEYHDFDFYDAHDLNNLMKDSSEETIKAKLRDRLNNTKTFLLLVGENTKNQYKFVKWEIEEAIKRDLPIIVVNLNNKKGMDPELCPSILKEKLALHIAFYQKIIYKAIKDWPDLFENHKKNKNTGPYNYKNTVYDELLK